MVSTYHKRILILQSIKYLLKGNCVNAPKCSVRCQQNALLAPSSVVTGELGWCKATLVYLVLTWGLNKPIALLRLRVQGRT